MRQTEPETDRGRERGNGQRGRDKHRGRQKAEAKKGTDR